jgi:arylsulfatase
MKQVASDFGGTRNGMVIRWPNGIEEEGGMRTQFGHVIDIAPTILEAATLPEPESVNGTPQTPISGTSLVYSFNDANAEERHTSQYFEIFGNRAMYHDGWLARTIHRAPWETVDLPPLENDKWELYNTREDFSLANNLADQYPEKLEELKTLFNRDAERFNVYPIDDRVIERTNPAIAGRPDVMAGRTSLTLYEGMDGMLENTFMNVKNKSKTITAELELPEEGASGAILVQGGRFGGWAFYMRDGKPVYTYNYLGLSRDTIAADKPIAKGKATVVLDFEYEGGGVGKGGMATISVNGEEVAKGRIAKTQPNMFSADETADVGLDNQTPVAEDIGIGRVATRFTGMINKITLEVNEVE